MSKFEPVDNQADRRQHLRRPVQRVAELLLRSEQTVHGCTILDESYGGVQVETPGQLDLPEQLMIKFDDQVSQLVRRCWATGNRVGFQYIEIVPVQRRWSKDLLAQFLQNDLAAVENFLCVSRTLLDLSAEITCEPADWLNAADQVRELLAEVPHVRLQLQPGNSMVQKGLQLFAIPQALETKPAAAARPSLTETKQLSKVKSSDNLRSHPTLSFAAFHFDIEYKP